MRRGTSGVGNQLELVYLYAYLAGFAIIYWSITLKQWFTTLYRGMNLQGGRQKQGGKNMCQYHALIDAVTCHSRPAASK